MINDKIEKLDLDFEQWQSKNNIVIKLQKIGFVLIVVSALLLFITALGFATTWGYGSGNIKDTEWLEKSLNQNDLLYKLSLFTLVITLLNIPFRVYSKRVYSWVQYSISTVSLIMVFITAIYCIQISNEVFPFISNLSESELRRLFLTNQSSLAEVNLFHTLTVTASIVSMALSSFFIGSQIVKTYHNLKLKNIVNELKGVE